MTRLRKGSQPRIWGLIALMVLIMAFCLSAASAEEFAVVYGTKTLNLRTQPSSSSTWLGSYPEGTWIAITGESGNWYSVYTPDGKIGYMSKNYLSSGSDALGVVAVVSNPKDSQFLNLRSQPSYSAKVETILYNGVPMPVLSNQGGWCYVNMNGVLGYVRSEFITLRNWVSCPEVATIKTPNNTALNLRSGPGTEYKVVRQFAGDRYVMVLQRGNGWWRVCADGYVGYMNCDFLEGGLQAARDIAGSTGGGGIGQPAYAIVNNPRTSSYLNLRESPSTASLVIGRFYNGTNVSIVSQGTQWCQVLVESTGQYGYMMTQYLKLYNLPAVRYVTVSHPQGLYVNLRQTPSLNAPVLAHMSSGARLPVVIPGTDWLKVSYNGQQGYVMTYFVQDD